MIQIIADGAYNCWGFREGGCGVVEVYFHFYCFYEIALQDYKYYSRVIGLLITTNSGKYKINTFGG
jgi:hypothetical protein